MVDVYDPMRLLLIPMVTALVAAVCLVIAFIAAGVGLISDLFILLAVVALLFTAWTALRHVLGGRERNIERRDSGSAQPGP